MGDQKKDSLIIHLGPSFDFLVDEEDLYEEYRDEVEQIVRERRIPSENTDKKYDSV